MTFDISLHRASERDKDDVSLLTVGVRADSPLQNSVDTRWFLHRKAPVLLVQDCQFQHEVNTDQAS